VDDDPRIGAWRKVPSTNFTHHSIGTNEKGKPVNPDERSAKITSLQHLAGVGRRARLRVVTGTGAPRALLGANVGTGAPSARGTRLGVLVAVLALALPALTATAASSASAATPAPWWRLASRTQPAKIAPGGEGTIVVDAVNLGDASTNGPATVADLLPAGFSVVKEAGVPEIGFYSFAGFNKGKSSGDIGPQSGRQVIKEADLCRIVGQRVSCTSGPTLAFSEEHSEQASEQRAKENEEREAKGEPLLPPILVFPSFLLKLEHLNPYENLEIRIRVKAPVAAGTYANRTEAQGGGASSVAAMRNVAVDSTPVSFGVEDFSQVPEEEGGEVDTQAGSHPFQFTTTLTLNQTDDTSRPPGLPRNLSFNLPAGFIGNATAVAQCSELDFQHISVGDLNLCPNDTAVGVAAVTIDEPENLGLVSYPVPLFNLAPTKGEPARFGFEVAGSPVTLDASVRTGSDYGVTIHVNNITELASFVSTTVTFWGVPGEETHNSARGWGCLAGSTWVLSEELAIRCEPSNQPKPPPFLTLPTACTSGFEPTVEGESWPTKAAPAGVPIAVFPYSLSGSFGQTLGFSGCNQLAFSPSIEVRPDVQAASTPSGLNVDVHVPQEVNENAAGLASSDVKDIAVTFPDGVAVNPAAGDGLQACSEAQIGLLPGTGTAGEPLFTADEPSCRDAAKIGTATIKSPLLPRGQFVEGALYLATPAPNGEAGMNPFNSLIATYIVAKDPISGVLVKLPGRVSLDQSTGRITATFDNNPQLAFEDAEIHLFGGSRAPFSTPARCGSYTTEAAFTPWSGNPAVSSQSSFDIISGPTGSACPGSLPFVPSLAAGMTNINAAAFSPLTTTISRADGNQNIQTVQLHTPPGLSGILAGVPLCSEANANAGTCGQGSLIGHTIVSVGLGNEPFSVTGGEVFLTEGYASAPFGLSIVNPAVAGPFNLGKVIVRAKIEVDPHTAALTVTTGTIPHILDGIPLQIKHVNVTVDRPGFTFNPTNCNPQRITGTIGSVEGATGPAAVPFQVTNCANLKFAPKFSVSTSGKTSKANGASLVAKLSYPKAAQGTQANITRVKVDLPKQLPSRLTTLQKACTNAQFELNPANCPSASKIGFAKVTTPLLPVPLEGPAIFVSHGGEAFPSLTMVLQGAPPYNVTVDLVGTTFISKQGVTSTTFKTVPDVPFNDFQLTLPQGKFSALAANGNLCKSKLAMPTEFLAQNGTKINQSTKVAVTGCPKAKKAKAKKKQVKHKAKTKGAK
jgi:hypothetical protein